MTCDVHCSPLSIVLQQKHRGHFWHQRWDVLLAFASAQYLQVFRVMQYPKFISLLVSNYLCIYRVDLYTCLYICGVTETSCPPPKETSGPAVCPESKVTDREHKMKQVKLCDNLYNLYSEKMWVCGKQRSSVTLASISFLPAKCFTCVLPVCYL